MSIEAMKQALEALEANVGSYHPLRRNAITALRVAIASYSTAINAAELREEAEKSNIKQVIELYDEPPAAPVQEHEPENEPFVSLASVQSAEERSSVERVEPVAWVDLENWLTGTAWPDDVFSENQLNGWTPLYTTPPAAQLQWVGLTADEMEGLYQLATYMDETDHIHMLMLAEEKLKEKNHHG